MGGGGRLPADRARRLQGAGADFLMCGSNTMHRVAPAIEAATTVPLVHVVDVLATDASRQVFVAAARALTARGADAVVLGCTEFGLLVHEHDVPGVPLLDTTTLHARSTTAPAVTPPTER